MNRFSYLYYVIIVTALPVGWQELLEGAVMVQQGVNRQGTETAVLTHRPVMDWLVVSVSQCPWY